MLFQHVFYIGSSLHSPMILAIFMESMKATQRRDANLRKKVSGNTQTAETINRFRRSFFLFSVIILDNFLVSFLALLTDAEDAVYIPFHRLNFLSILVQLVPFIIEPLLLLNKALLL